MDEAIGKHKAEMGKMDVIRRDSYFDRRIDECILMSVIVRNLEHAGESVGGKCEVVEAVGNSTDDGSCENKWMLKNNEKQSI